ncbi:acetylxylan esterase [Micromonospora sp. WMMD980]|uniref:acetylxylan esterase n=1 Tax=Micromonospora sp. WMMD980 TaxID=3016088 RepID=UPI002417125F|nr:acetylxylan esterase [Micromonospora sp. WMMD980]MDG4800251.1 acetylxylan esterase [Micromonospora sp. WMMD980]
MRIVDARVIVTCPGRNFVTLKIVTDEGVTGVGDATLNGRELAVASYLRDHLVPLLIGRDPARIEDTWQYLYQGSYWRRGPVTMSAIAAVDTALWDIKGKVAGLPVYQLLGGRSREGVTVYGHAALLVTAPFLCDVQRGIELTDASPYGDIARYLAVHREAEEAVRRTLSYVDGVTFARRATAPAHFGLGLRDDVCPPSTGFAAYNQYGGGSAAPAREMHTYPFNGHDGGEAVHVRRQLRWLDTVLRPTGRPRVGSGLRDRAGRR